MEPSWWEQFRGARVFLTGHTGFKGAWLLQLLSMMGAEVTGYALDPVSDGAYRVIDGDSLCRSVIADLRDAERLAAEMAAAQPDVVFHLAAQPLVRAAYAEPVDTFAVNVMGTTHVLDAVRRLAKPCTLVVITTDKVYASQEWEYPYREADRLGGHDPYSASKAMTEVVTDSYRRSFLAAVGVGVATARAGNVIGGGDWSPERLLPDVVRACQADQPVVLRNPGAVRPWQHVLEPVVGYLMLAAELQRHPAAYAEAWNFGPWPNEAMTVGEVVDCALACWGGGSSDQAADAGAPHETNLLRLDVSKAVARLGWRPRLSTHDAVRWTIDWYRHPSKEITEAQVREYLGLLG